ncbi:MAG: vanadium-dependent haloperoxidase [Acidobacteria bacterium]|nr:vanadium-dependent haloperoxidase [Acidobacteriota bacterium]
MKKRQTRSADIDKTITHSDKPENISDEHGSSGTSKSRRKFLESVGGLTAATLAAGLGALPVAETLAVAQDLTQDLTAAVGSGRADKAYNIRVQASLFQRLAPLPIPQNNGDEQRYLNRIGNYSKGLPHNQFGEVDQVAYNAFLQAVNSGNPDDFERINMGGTAQFKNPQAGLTFPMEGADPGHLYMPPPPAFSSAEIASEIAENYWMALARDINFQDYELHPVTIAAVSDLNKYSDFRGPRFRANVTRIRQQGGTELFNIESQGGTTSGNSISRGIVADQQTGANIPSIRRTFSGPVTAGTLFRGLTAGDLAGPYISQFLLKDIGYGVQTISQRMRTPIPGDDYLTSYDDWLFAQNSRGHQNLPNRYDQSRRYIRNGRDLGEWVHIDVLFQAYFNAAVLLLGMNAPTDSNNPYNDYRNQCGFGTFGPPHIQSLVCGVAANALRAVWYQKWYVHRRFRPEAFAGRIQNHLTNRVRYPINQEILNSTAVQEVFRKYNSYLLPMAFVEGCPSHPAYGAGHATVAGACVTVLKAWFNEDWVIPDPVVASPDGLSVVPYRGGDLTVGGELNKLASNVALGRNIAGVHWRSDATESLKLGEAIAISILTDQKACYNERFEGFSLTKFDGSKITI